MADLDTTHWAPLQDAATHGGLFPSGYAATSSDPTIADVGIGTGGVIAIGGRGVGSATITCTRNSDGAVATLDVTVTAGDAGEFAIELGTPVLR